jgi:hypothetical protein
MTNDFSPCPPLDPAHFDPSLSRVLLTHPTVRSRPMPDESLPPPVVHFIARHIATVEELEILLLLAREEGKAWTAEGIYQVVKSSRQSVAQVLARFLAAGFVTASADGHSIVPLAGLPLLHELSRCYREMPVRVIQAIYQRPRDAAQEFADAFKLKRKP